MNDQGNKITKTNIPTRLDRLPWGRFHTLIVIALGITWVLDGLEVTLAGSVAGALETSPRLHFTARDIGLAASLYLSGAIIGALGFASCEFLSVSVFDQGGDRRRKQRGEFHNPRNDPGAVPRVDRPCHQRLVLDRRRAWRRRIDRRSESRPV
jgi:hypothetical protein